MPRYTVAVRPDPHLFDITIDFCHNGGEAPRLSMPNWVPGSYMIREFARHITTIAAECDGRAVPLRQTAKNHWQAAENRHGRWQIRYTVYAFDRSVRGCYLDRNRAFFDGAALFIRIHGQNGLTHSLELRLPENWQYATSMPSDGENRHHAPDYETFIDHPLEAGQLTVLDFQTRGIPHRIVISGHHPDFDAGVLTTDTAAVCAAQLDFFDAEPPFADYTFLLHLGDQLYGGLEHRNSTALLADRHWLPRRPSDRDKDGYTELLGLISHEYFHAWNVKAVRPAAFAQSSLDREAYTEQLWAFEGITSYYDDLFLVRSGVLSPAGYLNRLAKLIGKVRQGTGRTRQTLAQSSFTAWDKYYKQNENSPNAIVSYYQQGALAALCLDLHLRRHSPAGHTLDDIMRRLYRDHLAGAPPLPEGRWEARAAEITGLPLQTLFDRLIRSTEELPLEELLPQAGLKLYPCTSDQAGFADSPPANTAPVPDFGARFQQNGHELTLTHVANGGSAEQAGLSCGDRIIALDGTAAADFAAKFAALDIGSRHAVHYFRQNILCETELTVQAATATAARLVATDPAALADWLQPPAGTPTNHTP